MRSLDRVVLAFFLAIFLTNCGQSPNTPSQNQTSKTYNGQTGSAKLAVSHSKSTNSEVVYGSVKSYKITITGDGIDEPITATLEGESEGAVIEGIPIGSDRKVLVEAENQNDQLIREGIVENVKVSGGALTEVEVDLDAVPIFTRLKDGNMVPSTRIRFELFADPEDPLEIEDEVEKTRNLLINLSTNEDEVYPDINTGLAMLRPVSLVPGEHVFTARSRRTGKSSSVKIKVLDGSKIKGAPLFGIGSLTSVGDYIHISKLGANGRISSATIWRITIDSVSGGLQ